MDIRKVVKGLLIIFVVVSSAVLVYKEFSLKSESDVTIVAATQADRRSEPDRSLPVPESQPSKKAAAKQKGKASALQSAVKSQGPRVIAYYFHGTFRCATCKTIEQYSKEAIEHYFSNELKDGTLEFRAVNVEEPESRHYIQDYQLFTKSLVISLNSDNRQVKWKVLKDVWTHVNDKDKFYQYVKDEVEKYLKEESQ